MTLEDSAEARSLRNKLVDALEARGDLHEGPVAEAMRVVPRHMFVPAAPLEKAYADQPVPIGLGQTISQPTIVAMMTEALGLTGNERVLEIGTGCGYQTAILARLAREVFTIEVIRELALSARQRFEALGLRNVHTKIGDGHQGWLEYAPFDRIILTAAPEAIPEGLLAQLDENGGQMIAPVGSVDRDQVLVVIKRDGEKFFSEELGGVRFVPMVRHAREWIH